MLERLNYGTRHQVRVLDIRPVNRPDGNVSVFHTLVTREVADFIDLGFVKSNPYYKNPDLWLDSPGNNEGGPPRVYPEGEPTDQGEVIQVPRAECNEALGQCAEPHWVVARVRNYGTIPAEQVQLEFFVCRPPGAGDNGNYQRFDTVIVPSVPPVNTPMGTPAIAHATWNVDKNERGHTCMRVVIADAQIPEDIAGIQLRVGRRMECEQPC